MRHLPGGIDQYVEQRRLAAEGATAPSPAGTSTKAPPGAVAKSARKEVARLERALEKLETRETSLHEEMAVAATDHQRLRDLQAQLAVLLAEREELEAAWMEQSEPRKADRRPQARTDAAKRSWTRRVSGPGAALIGRPSTRATGTTSAPVPVRNTSSAAQTSASTSRVICTRTLSARSRPIT